MAPTNSTTCARRCLGSCLNTDNSSVYLVETSGNYPIAAVGNKPRQVLMCTNGKKPQLIGNCLNCLWPDLSRSHADFLFAEQLAMMTNPTRALFTPEVIFTSPDELSSPTAVKKPVRSTAKRKFSFPVGLHSSSLLSSESNAIGRTSRRLSNVSDRVSDRVRKLSTAMGWHQSPSKDIIISQGKFLITLYIRFRLKRCGALNQQKKRIGLQKMQRGLLIGADVKDVFTALKEAATVLESMHVKIYTNVSRQLSSSPNSLENPEDTAVLLTTFGRILFKSGGEITWAKVISLFSVTAGLSIDLVRQNHEDHIPTLIEGFLGVIEDELMPFLSENSGWISLHNKLQYKKNKATQEWSLVLVLLAIFIVFFLLNNYLIKF